MDHGADISEYSQFQSEAEFLWNPCSLVEGQGHESIETTKDGIVTKILVRMNNNVKTQTVEELRELKKTLHLNAFKYILNEISSDLLALAQARYVNSRAEDDLSVTLQGKTADLAISELKDQILKDCQKRFEKHQEKGPDEFIQDETYRGLVRDMMETKAMAIAKLRLWLEDTSQLWKGVCEMDLRTAHRTLIRYLEQGIAEAGEETALASYELCKMRNLITMSIDELNDLKEPVIVQASAEGADFGTLQLLVKAGADINATDAKSWTAVMKASFAGHTKTVEALLSFSQPNSAKLDNKNNNGETALLLAAQEGHYEIFQALIGKRASIDVLDNDCSTALMKASQNGHKSIVKHLLDLKDLKIKLIERFDSKMNTPVMMAAQGGHTEILKLLQTSADQADHPYNVNFFNSRFETALHYASLGGHIDTMNALFERNADMTLKNGKGMTPLMMAASNGKTAAVKLLLEHHKEHLKKTVPNHGLDDINLPLRETDSKNLSVVVHAASHSKTECLSFLLECKADATAGLHSLCRIITKSTKELQLIRAVQALVDSHADINTPNSDRKTILESTENVHVRMIIQSKGGDRWTEMLTAAEKGDTELVKTLETKHADENVRCESALHIAALEGHRDVVELLIKIKADVNKIDKSGQTALHAAAKKGSIGSMRALVNAKAEVNRKDNEKNSPLAYVKDKSCKYFLKMMGADKYSPLMVAAEQGISQVSQYLLLREAVLCFHLKAPMPAWFDQESLFYSGLVKCEVQWTFCQKIRKLDTNSKEITDQNGIRQNHDGLSCVLGSFVLHEGIHSWELLLGNVSKMSIGIARGEIKNNDAPVGGQPSKDDTFVCEYLLAVDEKGGISKSVESAELQSIMPGVGFSSNQTIGLELDTYKKTLKVKVNSMLVAVIYGVETREVRPFVSTSKGESVQLLSCNWWSIPISEGAAVNGSASTVDSTSNSLQGSQGQRGLLMQAMDKQGSDRMLTILLGRITEEPVLKTITDHILAGSDINAANDEHFTAIHIAARMGQTAVVRKLLEAKAELDGHIDGHSSCLHVAAKCGDTGTLIELLHAKARIDARDAWNRTSLHEAACAGKSEAVRLLIIFKASITSRDDSGHTPLEACTEYTDTQKKYGPDVTQVKEFLKLMEQERRTPLMLAISESGVQRSGNSDSLKIIETLITDCEDVNAVDSRSQCCLHIAAEKGDVKVIKALIAGNASIAAEDDNKQTPLHRASAAGQQAAVMALVQAKGNVHACDKKNNTALNVSQDLDCSHTLQIAGAGSWTPLMVAAKTRNSENYLKFRDLYCRIKQGKSFPAFFVVEMDYYANLNAQEVGWTWDQQRQSSGLSEVVKVEGGTATFSDLSCVFGSEIFKDGVHSWELSLDNITQFFWVGIGRDVDRHNPWNSSGCKLAFSSNMQVRMDGLKVNKITKILSGFQSGDLIKLELDMHERCLKISKGGILACIATGISDISVRPLVIMDQGSVTLVEGSRISRLPCSAQSTPADNKLQALDNSQRDPLTEIFFKSEILVAQAPEYRTKIMSYLSYLLANLAADLCLGDESRILKDIENIDVQNEHNCTALHISAEVGNLDCVRSLLLLGADPSIQDRHGDIPAKKARSCEICSKILACVLQEASDEDIIKSKPLVGTLEDTPEVRQGTRVVLSAAFRSVGDAACGPLKFKEEGVIQYKSGNFWVVEKNSCTGTWCYEPQALSLAEPKDYRWSLLMVAVEAGHIEQIKEFLNKDSVNVPSGRQCTPLHIAVSRGNKEAVISLIEGNANLEAKDDYNRTPLHVAAEHGFTEIMLLLVHGKPASFLEVRDLHGYLPWHYAATASGEAVRLLAKLKASLNETDTEERTALHLAAKTGSIDCLSALLELKVDHHAIAKDKSTALDICKHSGCKYMLRSVGVNGWNPLMALCERGDDFRSYALENDALMLCLNSIKKKEPFPLWFQQDVCFFTRLSTQEQAWTWGLFEPSLSKSSDSKKIEKLAGHSPNYSCVLGSHILEAGVHEWEVIIEDVRNMWAGIARGFLEQESNFLSSGPGSGFIGDNGFLLVFSSSDCTSPFVCGEKQPTFRSIPNSKYSIGDKITFQLDKKRHILRLKINGVLSVVVANVDDEDVRPYVCMEYTGTFCLGKQVSRVFHERDMAEDDNFGLNNSIWSNESDACLQGFINQGLIHSLPSQQLSCL